MNLNHSLLLLSTCRPEAIFEEAAPDAPFLFFSPPVSLLIFPPFEQMPLLLIPFFFVEHDLPVPPFTQFRILPAGHYREVPPATAIISFSPLLNSPASSKFSLRRFFLQEISRTPSPFFPHGSPLIFLEAPFSFFPDSVACLLPAGLNFLHKHRFSPC